VHQELSARLASEAIEGLFRLFKSPHNITEERTGVSISTDASLKALMNQVAVAPPTREIPVVIEPSIDCVADEFNQLGLSRHVAGLRDAYKSNCDFVSWLGAEVLGVYIRVVDFVDGQDLQGQPDEWTQGFMDSQKICPRPF
jgi:hypothetical protein